VENPVDPCLRNWEGARAFLEVARRGSFRSASQALQLSVNTLRRHVEEFEREVGLTLFTRHVDGVRVTAEGEMLIGAVKRMEAASLDIVRARNIGETMSGEVRLGVTEGLGTFWLAPRLVEYQRAHPGLLIDLRCAMHPTDVLRLETDITIQITRPTDKDLIIVKLGRLHAMFYASQEYLDTHGTPKDISELSKHRVVLQVCDQVAAAEGFAKLFPGTPQLGTVSFRSNVSSANYLLIARGAGIGALPTYAQALGIKLIPIDVGNIRFANDIWLAYHPDAAKIARVRSLIDWLVEVFSPKKYPWFADEFIHPRDLPAAVGGHSVPSLFAGFDEINTV
jgi:DNA-binding transcriptional LysR family regulator